MRQDETGIIIYETDPSGLITVCKSISEVPSTANKFAPGCVLIGSDGKTYTNGGTAASPSFQDSNEITTSEIATGAVTLAKLAAGITASHIVKFFKLGSTITTTVLTGAVVGDLVVRITALGVVSVEAVAVANTLPTDPADTDYVIVFRATA